MVTSLKTRWQFALFAALLYLTAPVFNAAYDMIEDGRGAYPPNADSIIDIYFFAIGLTLFLPFYAAAVWLATRSYHGGRSLLVFDTHRPLWSGFWSLLLGGLALLALYDAASKAIRILPLDVVSDMLWAYLLLCLRSSLVGGKEQEKEIPVHRKKRNTDSPIQ